MQNLWQASGIGVKDDLMYKQNCKLLEENAKLKEALNFERVVREDNQEAMAKSISSQIKMYEVLQKKYEDAVNEAEAHKIKYTSQIKEQKLEIVTMKRALRRERVKAEESPNRDEANASPPAERLDWLIATLPADFLPMAIYPNFIAFIDLRPHDIQYNSHWPAALRHPWTLCVHRCCTSIWFWDKLRFGDGKWIVFVELAGITWILALNWTHRPS